MLFINFPQDILNDVIVKDINERAQKPRCQYQIWEKCQQSTERLNDEKFIEFSLILLRV